MTQITPLLKELHEVNTAIANAEEDLKALREKRQWLNCQISEYLVADNEMNGITRRLEKTREALAI